MEKQCKICNKIFVKPVACSLKEWSEKRKYCSHKCYSRSLSTNKEWKEKLSLAHKGLPGFWTGKRRPDISGDKAYQWKGKDVSYAGLHIWVTKHLGKPKKCEHCGRTDLLKYEWANISQEYKRDLSDWIRLCKSCHNLYDDIGNKVWIQRRLK